MSKDFGDTPSPEKEEAVREALGVEKRFGVRLVIPITGTETLREIIVMALNEEDAEEKAIKLVMEGGVDEDGCEPEMDDTDYDYGPTFDWTADVYDA